MHSIVSPVKKTMRPRQWDKDRTMARSKRNRHCTSKKVKCYTKEGTMCGREINCPDYYLISQSS